MPVKVKTAKVILQVMGWLGIAAAVICLIFFLIGSIILGVSGEEDAAIGSAIMGGTGLVISIITAFFGVVYLITAKGIANKKNWAKIVGIILGILALPSIPIGTAIGIFVLIGLLGPDANTWFES